MNRLTLLLLPALLITAFVGVFPLFALINYSVQTPFALENNFVGLTAFRNAFWDARFINAVARNVLFAAIALAIEIPLGLGLAYLLRGPGKLNSILSALIILPPLFPAVTIGMMWLLMVRSNGPFGLILNNIAKLFGGTFDPFKNSLHAFGTIIAMDVWHWTGLVFLVSYAALSSMDESYVMSARTEGATRWQIFRYAELPQLQFPLIFISLLRFIDALKIFDEVFILTGGGPGLSTEFVTQYIRTLGIEQWNIGYASSLSLIYLYTVIILCWLLIVGVTKGRGVMQQ